MLTKLYTSIVNSTSDKLYRYVVKQGVPAEDARDIVQNCFEALWKSSISDDTSGAKYLFGAAYNQCANYWRQHKRISYREQLPENTLHVASAQSIQLQPMLHKALLQLSEQERSLVLLKDYEGYSYEEIADITQLSATQVKVYLHRSRTKLREYIGQIKQVI
jgi:RNA polymerase sigma factor (sigma-70 family)